MIPIHYEQNHASGLFPLLKASQGTEWLMKFKHSKSDNWGVISHLNYSEVSNTTMGNLGCCEMNRALCWRLWPLNVHVFDQQMPKSLYCRPFSDSFNSSWPLTAIQTLPSQFQKREFSFYQIYYKAKEIQTRFRHSNLVTSIYRQMEGSVPFLIHLNLTATFSTVEQIQNHLLETVMVAGSLPVQLLPSWVCGVPVCIRFKMCNMWKYEAI